MPSCSVILLDKEDTMSSPVKLCSLCSTMCTVLMHQQQLSLREVVGFRHVESSISGMFLTRMRVADAVSTWQDVDAGCKVA